MESDDRRKRDRHSGRELHLMFFLPQYRYFPVAALSGGGAGATDPHFANVVFLSDFEGTDGAGVSFTEDSNSGHTVTGSGTAVFSDDQARTGTTSLFAGTGGASCADSDDWDLSDANADEFTIEYSIYNSGSLPSQWDVLSSFSGSFGWLIRHGSGGEITFFGSNDGSGLQINFSTSGASLGSNAWNDICIEKDSGGKIRIYVDGVMRGSDTPVNSALHNSSGLAIGNHPGGPPTGYVDRLRITKGVARYASDSGYTPSDDPFPTS